MADSDLNRLTVLRTQCSEGGWKSAYAISNALKVIVDQGNTWAVARQSRLCRGFDVRSHGSRIYCFVAYLKNQQRVQVILAGIDAYHLTNVTQDAAGRETQL